MLFPTNTLISLVLVAAPLVAAHGKMVVANGDAGGNGTALGIKGAVVPGPGANKVTEPDTTVFKGANADGCGQTKGAGQNEIVAGTKAAMAQSGDTLPQVTAGGYLEGTMHVVTSDGFGPYKAMMDPTATGDFSGAKSMVMMTQVPGNKGNGKKTQKRAWERALEAVGIMKRATNINEDFPFKVAIPADAKCTGSMAGMENVCMVKLVNPSAAGPFGGCVPVQMVPAGGAPAPAPAPARRVRRALKN